MGYLSLFVSLVSLFLVIVYIQFNERRERNKKDAREAYQESIKHQLESIRNLLQLIGNTETDGEG